MRDGTAKGRKSTHFDTTYPREPVFFKFSRIYKNPHLIYATPDTRSGSARPETPTSCKHEEHGQRPGRAPTGNKFCRHIPGKGRNSVITVILCLAQNSEEFILSSGEDMGSPQWYLTDRLDPCCTKD
jgi:hypothetical protein